MGVVGSLQQVVLLVTIAVAAALCGFIASAVSLRNKRRARGYFVLGVLTGLIAATITRRRYRRLASAVGARRLILFPTCTLPGVLNALERAIRLVSFQSSRAIPAARNRAKTCTDAGGRRRDFGADVLRLATRRDQHGTRR
jgi:hypothetical protein